MNRILLVFAQIGLVALPLTAQEPTTTNSIGMEFVLIQPGTMQVGVYKPYCPNPNKAAPSYMSAGFGGAGGGAGRGAAPGGALQGGGFGAAGGPPAGNGPAGAGAPGGPAAGNGPAGGGGQARPAVRSPYSQAEFERCEELAKKEGSEGFAVKITKPYYIGKYEVTQGQWKKVMGNNPSTFHGDLVSDDADKHPVETVTWEQAQQFVKKLNEMEHTKAYRLPTEFEWEYAGRAGGPGQANWSESVQQAVMSNPGPSGRPQTTAMVGSMKPNAWGLYDMLGNVWEWVADPYNDKMFADPTPSKSGKQHVLKGGGMGAADRSNTSYAYHGAGPADEYDVGFRVLRDLR
jgi:formylglycine-generating enzyme